MFIAQLPTPAPGSIEAWLIPAAAVLSVVALGKKEFAIKKDKEKDKANGTSGGGLLSGANGQFATKSELHHELTAVRDKIDARFLTVAEKIEVLGSSINDRLAKLEAAV